MVPDPFASSRTPALDITGAPDPRLWWWWLPAPATEPQREAPSGGTGTPAPCSEEVTLRDGTRAWVRPLLRSDREMHATAYQQLSDTAKYHRFLVPVPELTEDLLVRLVDEVDQVDHVAYYLFVADSPLPIGIGRIVRDPEQPDVADIAVTVHDDYQGRGVASALLTVLIAQRPAGVTRLQTIVAPGNHASLAMLRRLGPTRLDHGREATEVRVDLVGDGPTRLDDLAPATPPAPWRRRLRTRDLICPWLGMADSVAQRWTREVS